MPVYINKKSNHSPTIIKDIPKAIAKRISSSEAVFSVCPSQYIKTHSQKVISMTTVHFSQKPHQHQDK